MPAPEIESKASERYRRQLAAEAKRVRGSRDRSEAAQRRVTRLAGLRRAAGAAAIQATAGIGGVLRKTWRLFERARTPMPTRDSRHGDRQDFLVIGHRGAAKHVVENTIPSCIYAIENGANALEIDLSMTADGQIVLWHDWNPNDTVSLARQLGLEPGVKYLPRTPRVWDTKRRMAHKLTLEELRTHHGYQRSVFFFFRKRVATQIPTLRDFLDWATHIDGLRAVFLDVKIPGNLEELAAPFARVVNAILEDFRPRFACIFMTPHKNIMRAMKPHVVSRTFSWDTEVAPGVVLDSDKYSGVRAALAEKNGVASIGRPALTWGAWRLYQEIIEADVARLSEHHREAKAEDRAPDCDCLIAWTINARNEQRRLLHLGVHGILTDDPRPLARLANREGLAKPRS